MHAIHSIGFDFTVGFSVTTATGEIIEEAHW
jgi:hypothetical protein